MEFLMPPNPLTNFEIQKYYENEPTFNGVYSRNNMPEKKDGAYVINLDEYANLRTHWIASFCNRSETVYFNSFGVEHGSEEIKDLIGNKSTKSQHFLSTGKRFNNVWVLLHWIHLFYTCR